MSDDPKQEYFSDGITENIITALSKVHNIFVIARNSTFTYKSKSVKIQQVAEELGVRYVLEGSVQKTEDRLRINAQLIDAITGKHLWAERFDRDLVEIFALQDEITKKIITSLHVKLALGDDARVFAQHTDNFEAYLKFLEANNHFLQHKKDANLFARQLFKQAIALDVNFASAYDGLAWTYLTESAYGWTNSRAKSLEAADELAQKALSLDDSFPAAYVTLSSVHLQKGEVRKAVALREKAVALGPSSANNHTLLGVALLFMGGRTEQAIKEIKVANRLDPFPPDWILHYLGAAYRVNGEYEKAIEIFKKVIKRNPDYWISHLGLSACYGLLGREEEARAAAAEVLRIRPNFSIAKVMNPYRDKADKERTIEVLRRAGLPENPPIPLPDKPSIAVLPFNNMSGDPEQEYFSDGITEEIITALSKVPKIFVIARNSSFTYKGKAVKVQQVGRELGVRYVLEGSVRKSGDKIRITAQLVDTTTGGHLWAERYDRELKEIFTLQDEITMKIIAALRVELTDGEQARLRGKGTENLQAYLKWLRAYEHFNSSTKEDNVRARLLLEETISLDAEFPQAYSLLGATHWVDMFYGSSKSPEESLKRAFELTKKAIALDDSFASAHSYLGLLYTITGEHDKAMAECGRAVDLDSNNALAHIWMGRALR
jgi:TolB-like protein/Flp pilus assembly protein TadD